MTIRQLLFLLLCLLFCTPAISEPDTLQIVQVNIPMLTHDPVIDGELNEPEWAKASLFTNFKLTSGEFGKSASQQTECKLYSDGNFLYVAFHCRETDTSLIKANNTIWDSEDIFYDDRVTILLDVNHDHRSYYELTVNPLGVQMDREGFIRYPNTRTSRWELNWNCFWRARTTIGKDHWNAEIAIDLSTLGIEQVDFGFTIGFNVGRVRSPQIEKGEEWAHRQASPPEEYSAFKPVKDGLWESISNFYEPSQFADLVFGDPKMRVETLAFPRAKYNWGDVFEPSSFGWNPLKINLDARELNEVRLHLSVESEKGQSWEMTEDIDDLASGIINTSYFVPTNGENRLVIELSDAASGALLYYTTYTLTIPPFITFDLEPLYTRYPAKVRPIQFRLETDELTLSQGKLLMSLVSLSNGTTLAEMVVEDLSKCNAFQPVFNVGQLRQLPGGDYVVECKMENKTDNKTIGVFNQPFTKFDLQQTSAFHAVRGPYSYGGIKDDAITVHYLDGEKFVFWRGANYGPWWDIDQAALNHEHLESWGAYTQSCCEVMQDRELRYSKVEIVENTPARVVVHWRYALADSQYKIHMNEWGEEFYRFYPDGTIIREVNLWANSNKKHEFFEAIPVKPPGVRDLQLYEEPLASLSTLEGKTYSTDDFWSSDMDFYQDFVSANENLVFEFNFKDRKHPFVVFSFTPDLLPGVEPEYVDLCSPRKNITRGDHRGHWPTSLYPIDGYNAVGSDRPHHGNIGSIKAMSDKDGNPNKYLMLLGVTEPANDTKILHAKSWIYPIECKSLTKEVHYLGFDQAEKCYKLQVNGKKRIDIELTPEGHLMVNPVFKVAAPKSLPQLVLLDGNELPDSAFAVGKAQDGSAILFINRRIEKKTRISIGF